MEWHKPPFRLKEIKIEVTHDCIQSCVHCSSIAGKNTGRNMDWASCEKILDDANTLGVKKVAFSGGEPLLWEDLPDAITKAAQNRMDISLYTTGNVPNASDLLDALQTEGLSCVMFSLFGENATQHESVTTNYGSYQKTLEITTYCINLGLDTEFHFVPMSHNYRALHSIAEQARRMGVSRVSVLRLVPQGRSAGKKDSLLSTDQNLELREIIENLRANGHDIRLGSPYNFLMLHNKPKCCSGIDRLIIGPDQRIFPCDAFKHILPEEIGARPEFSSLSEHSLVECWEKSPYLWAIRNYLTTDFASECSDCQKQNECLSGCLAQKFYAHGKLKKCPDPMCLLGKA